MREIYHCFWINASLQKVHWALTEKSGLTGWWTKSSEVINRVGSISTFRFKSGAFNKMKILSLNPNKIAWICVDGHEEWVGTQITFELQEDNSRIKVCFSHYDWKKQSEYTGECSFHWVHYLVSLRNLCEIGAGKPDEGL